MSETTFVVYISTEVALTVEDVWPDGGAPECPTDAEVARAMREYGDKRRTLRDWCLLEDLDVSVGCEDVWEPRRQRG